MNEVETKDERRRNLDPVDFRTLDHTTNRLIAIFDHNLTWLVVTFTAIMYIF